VEEFKTKCPKCGCELLLIEKREPEPEKSKLENVRFTIIDFLKHESEDGDMDIYFSVTPTRLLENSIHERENWVQEWMLKLSQVGEITAEEIPQIKVALADEIGELSVIINNRELEMIKNYLYERMLTFKPARLFKSFFWSGDEFSLSN
jgi:hypothetical protein